ncbi:MAG: hypothetical protein V9F04_14995 [Dermatophilaceae bacterium]
MPRVRRAASQEVRLDRRDVQGVRLLPHRLAGRRQERIVVDGLRGWVVWLGVRLLGVWGRLWVRVLWVLWVVRVGLLGWFWVDHVVGFGRLTGHVDAGIVLDVLIGLSPAVIPIPLGTRRTIPTRHVAPGKTSGCGIPCRHDRRACRDRRSPH